MKKKSSKVSEPEIVIYQKSKLTPEKILNLDTSGLNNPLNRIEFYRSGLTKSSFESFKTTSGLDYLSLAKVLGVSAKTLQRKEFFDTAQSERLYQLADFYAVGINYFGEEGFRKWMERPLFTLDHHIPINLIDSSEGIELLKTEILRLQHGIAV